MPIWSYLAAAVLVGALVTAQPLINANLSRALGSPFVATAISILVAFVAALVVVAITGRGETSRAALVAVPWWVYLAGLIGTIFVSAGMIIAPVTGAFAFFLCVIAGQLIGAAIYDHIGAFGVQVRPMSVERLLGLALVLGGAVLVQRG